MNGMIKKAWLGLMLGLGLLAGINANAADLAISSLPTALTSGNALVFTPDQAIGTESVVAQTVTLTAVGGTVNFDALGISSPNFSMQDNNCAATLAISTSCTFTVKFSPETAGTRYAELIIRSDAANATNGAHTVYLQGTATKATQTVTFGPAPTTILVGGTGAVTASASSGLPVTFAHAGACTVDVNTGTVTGTSAASCTITATQAGNANYTAASALQTFNINSLATQTITNLTVPTISVGGTGTVTATGGGSGNAVTFGSATPGVCTVSGSTVTGVSAGTCTIAANQAGNGSYSAATQVTADGTVNSKSSQSITFGTAPTVTVGGTGSVSASASSGLAVSFSTATTGVCTISGSTVTGVSAGTCTIAADQAGNGSYNPAAQVPQSFTVAAAPVEPPAGELCTQYGLTTNNELTRAGNTSKYKTITTAQGYSFSFTTGAVGTSGQASTNYSSTAQYITLSKSKCDYAPALETARCAIQGTPPLLYYRVGGTSAWQCVLEPNTTYYFNVRNASRDPTTKAFTNLCTGSCNFMAF